MSVPEPLVTVITPVYNGAAFLRECIESVLTQTYRNFEYIIQNNCSTDDSLQIAEEYAQQDKRIRVVSTERLLPIYENFNRSLTEMSPASSFYRTVHADDMIYPTCLEKSVALAMRDPSIGVVGSLRLRGNRIECGGLPTDRDVFTGAEIVRWFLKGEIYGFAATSSLVRAELVRERKEFYPLNGRMHSDLEVFFDIFRSRNYGFVHEVLAFSREHENSITTTWTGRLQTLQLERLDHLREFGPDVFSAAELAKIRDDYMRGYHRLMLRNFLARNHKFLSFHMAGLRERGMSPSPFDFGRALLAEGAAALRRPGRSYRWIKDMVRRNNGA